MASPYDDEIQEEIEDVEKEAEAIGSMYWQRWQELCVKTPGYIKAFLFHSSVKGLTWLLPERFSASEIGPEAVTAFLGIITAVNQHIIDTTPIQMPSSSAEPYSFPYSLCISAIKDLETLVEVVAIHHCGEDKKWNFIAVTEATKVLVRLALFRNSGYKMLLHGGETPNTETNLDFSNAQQRPRGAAKHGGHLGPGHSHTINGHNQWNLEGRALSALSRFGENARMVSEPVWLRRIQLQHAIMEPSSPAVEGPTLSMIISEKGVRGALFLMEEFLFITRPLIYVLLIRKYGIRSWIPWFLSLGVDFIGTGILTKVINLRYGGKDQKFYLTVSEQDELKRRKLLWALYLMRDPFFGKYTRRRLESAEKLMEPVPIIGLLTGKLVELLIGAQSRYTYMSGS